MPSQPPPQPRLSYCRPYDHAEDFTSLEQAVHIARDLCGSGLRAGKEWCYDYRITYDASVESAIGDAIHSYGR